MHATNKRYDRIQEQGDQIAKQTRSQTVAAPPGLVGCDDEAMTDYYQKCERQKRIFDDTLQALNPSHSWKQVFFSFLNDKHLVFAIHLSLSPAHPD